MPPLLRLPLFALVCVALLAGFAVAFASWWGEAGGAWDVLGLGRRLVFEGRRQQELEAHDRAVVACLHGKYRVTEEVLAGRLTVEEAVEHFRRLEDARDETREVWFDGAARPCPVWERDRLPDGARFAGPAIVEEFGATTVVPPGWRARLDAHGGIRLEREGST